ncbi:MAG: peptidase inhibitor family I36 protein [Mycobacteriales bacterium]
MKKSSIRRCAALLITVALGSLLLATPASAASGYNRCLEGWFCGFTDDNGSGKYASFQVRAGAPYLKGTDYNDRFNSVRNNTGDTWCLYNKSHYDLSDDDAFVVRVPRYTTANLSELSELSDEQRVDDITNRVSSLRTCS